MQNRVKVSTLKTVNGKYDICPYAISEVKAHVHSYAGLLAQLSTNCLHCNCSKSMDETCHQVKINKKYILQEIGNYL